MTDRRAGTDGDSAAGAIPEEWQRWAASFAGAQQAMIDHLAGAMHRAAGAGTGASGGGAGPSAGDMPDTAGLMGMMSASAALWAQGLDAWSRILAEGERAADARDKRFAAPAWADHPLFDAIARNYRTLSAQLMASVEEMPGLDPRSREAMRFAVRGLTEAMSPANYFLSNPEVMQAVIDSRGESALAGMKNMLADLERGQLTQSPDGAFELGRNLATTPGEVIHETALFQLIHYRPTTPQVAAVPVLVFPPWINRFYILDLTPEKSFVRWAVDQGLSLFMVSWKSADSSMAEIGIDDYVAAQVEAVEVVRRRLDVPAVHAIGYCVAGTTLAMTLAWLEARGRADEVRSATFFTAQVDFADGGELLHFTTDEMFSALQRATEPHGYLDGRVMAGVFNLLRGRDLIWSYVVNNYLMGRDPPAFDLLHWNGDVTNLPARWHRDYIDQCYRQNLLVQPGGIMVDGVAIDLGTIDTPMYVQAGREDHIAPIASVWKIAAAMPKAPLRFVEAGSGHIAGVVNPPASGKYQHWTWDGETALPARLDDFRAGAREVKGSWWPDWRQWLRGLDGAMVDAVGARVPADGIEPAPGRYVATR